MFYGWAGTDIEIDLSNGNIEKAEIDSELYKEYLGGRGVGAKMTWDRVRPETDAFSPENLLIFNAGVLCGTTCPGANRTIVTTKSPQMNLQTYGSFGGFFGPQLKLAGYDSIILNGKAPHPVYLSICDDKVEIRDARHLWGKDTFETQALIRRELGTLDAHIACIGPAGENRAFCASIEHGPGASASRSGIGAVMGDKNLKAISVQGNKDLKIARPAEFGELCDRMVAGALKQKEWVDDFSHNQVANLSKWYYRGNLGHQEVPTDLWHERGDAHEAYMKESCIRRPACFNCQIACHHALKMPSGRTIYTKCGSHLASWASYKFDDFDSNFRVYEMVEAMGMCVYSAGVLGAFAIDLYEKGILTLADTDGLHLEFGNVDVAIALTEKIARREGIGDVLANGVVEAAKQIGRGAEEHMAPIKKLEALPASHQQAYIALAEAISDRADVSRLITWVPQHLFHKTEEERREYQASQYWPYPDEWRKYALDPFDPNISDWERISKMVSRDRDMINLQDNVGVCSFWADFYPYGPLKSWHLASLFSYATGVEIDEEEALKRCARSGALIRAYNNILGIRRRDDTVAERFFRDVDGDRFGPLNRPNFDKVIDEYYRLRGWNQDGVPTAERLNELGLGFVVAELERRGIYRGPVPA